MSFQVSQHAVSRSSKMVPAIIASAGPSSSPTSRSPSLPWTPRRTRRSEKIIRQHLAVVPLSQPGQVPARVVELPPPAALVVAAVMRAAEEKWAALAVGAELSYEWTPRRSPAARPALATVPARPRREGGKGSAKAWDRHGQRRREPKQARP